MYGMALIVGGRRTAAFETALPAVLAELGASVLERTTVHEWSQRYEWVRSAKWGRMSCSGSAGYGEVPSLAVSELSCGSGRFLSIDVRCPRLPLWNLGLARRLSARLGVWAAAMVNDRLYDEYGCGFFYAGHVIEAAVRGLSGIVLESGAKLSWFSGRFADLEDENRRNFRARVAALSGAYDVPGRPPIDVLALGAADGGSLYDFDASMRSRQAEASSWLDVHAGPVTRAVVADHGTAHVDALQSLERLGWTLAVHDLPPSYRALPDGTLDEVGVNAVVLAGGELCALDPLLAAVESTPAAAAGFRFGAHSSEVRWRERGGAWNRTEPCDLPALIAAHGPIARITEEPPLRWDFRPISQSST
jgi:hypothetical protein